MEAFSNQVRIAHLMCMSEQTQSPAMAEPLVGLERLLTVEELSEYLHIPVTTLYDWRVDRIGPKAVKLGRALRYPESCVRAWIDGQFHG